MLVSSLDMKSELALGDCFVVATSTTILRLRAGKIAKTRIW